LAIRLVSLTLGARPTVSPLGYGVIGNTADSGSVVLGSSPGTPATVRTPRERGFFFPGLHSGARVREAPMRLRRSDLDAPGIARGRRGRGFAYTLPDGSTVDTATR